MSQSTQSIVILAARLYEAHRRALEDPTSVPAWGNASTEERRAWEAAAEVAMFAARFDSTLELARRQIAASSADAARERIRAAYYAGCYQQWALMNPDGNEVARGVDFEGSVVFVALADSYVTAVEKVHHGHGPRRRFAISMRYLQRGDTMALDTREQWS